MKCFVDNKPEGAFFAVFSDLSGASMFYKHDGGYRNPVDGFDVDDITWFLDAGYLWFFEIDDTFINHVEEIK